MESRPWRKDSQVHQSGVSRSPFFLRKLLEPRTLQSTLSARPLAQSHLAAQRASVRDAPLDVSKQAVPSIVNAHLASQGTQVTGIAITFSKPMVPATVTNVRNYSVVDTSQIRRPVTGCAFCSWEKCGHDSRCFAQGGDVRPCFRTRFSWSRGNRFAPRILTGLPVRPPWRRGGPASSKRTRPHGRSRNTARRESASPRPIFDRDQVRKPVHANSQCQRRWQLSFTTPFSARRQPGSAHTRFWPRLAGWITLGPSRSELMSSFNHGI